MVKNFGRDRSYLFFLVPGLLFIVAFVLFPLVYNFYLSFHKAHIIDLARGDLTNVGLANYVRVVTGPDFGLILQNTVVFTVGSIVLQYFFGLMIASFFREKFPLSMILRGLLMLGWLIPPILVGTTWRWMMNTQVGVINYLLLTIGIISDPVPWLVGRNTALLSVTLANVWFGIPFNVIILTSALGQIPESYYEAANLEGAKWHAKLFHITLPLIRKDSLALLMIGFIFGFRLFDLIWVMTNGGPVLASTVLSIYSYQYSFELFRFGMGSAVTSISFLIVLSLAVIYVRSVREEDVM